MTESDQINQTLEAMIIRRRLLIKNQMEELERSLESLEYLQKNIDAVRKNKPLRFRKPNKTNNTHTHEGLSNES